MVPAKMATQARGGPERRTLVLGDRAIGRRLVESLEEAGHSAERLESPRSIDELKEALVQFAAAEPHSAQLFVHPGVTSWAERPEILALAHELGVVAFAPPAKALTLFSNKLNLLTEAERLSVPNLVLSFDPLRSPREIEQLMSRAKWGFPFVLKASRSSAGFGRYLVREAADLEQKLGLWTEQLRLSAGEAMLFAERYVEGARYVTLPFARFQDGGLHCFPLCDSSLQSRFRKVLEFCPCSGVDPAIETRLQSWVAALTESSGYVGLGALEFLVDGPRAYLIEGLARLNTNFHLWESVAGINAVAWQLAALLGEKPPAAKPDPDWASGIAMRFLAEDSLLQLPQPGTIHELSDEREWSFPGAVAELDLALDRGERVKPSGSSLIGHLWVGGRDSARALTVARGVLDEIWIAGSLQTNERFLAELINHPWVKAGLFHAGFVDEEFLPAIRPSAEVFQAFAALGAEAATPASGNDPQARWSVGDQWAKPAPLDWAVGPKRFEIEGKMARLAGVSGTFRLKDGRSLRACAYPIGRSKNDRWLTRAGNWTLAVRQVPGKTASTAREAARPRISALVSGRVHSVLFREGGVIPAHEAFLIIESLGVLVPHALPREVRVLKWRVAAEDEVSIGEELADFELIHN